MNLSMAGRVRDFVQKAFGMPKTFPLRQFLYLFAALVSVCAYPALFVYFNNIHEAVFAQTLAPTAVFVAVGLAAWLFFGVLSGKMSNGAFVALMFMFIFINYARIDDGIRSIAPDWRWWRIAPAFLCLLINLALVLRIWGARRGRRGDFSRAVVSIGILYVALTIGKAASGMPSLAVALRTENRSAPSPAVLEAEIPKEVSGHDNPNFYYFIFDEYARQDVLKKYTGYDNAPFLDGLERKGFGVSRSSRSCCATTTIVIGNLLHYSIKYTTVMGAKKALDRPPLLGLFRKAGYRTYWHSMLQVDKESADVVLRSASILTALSIGKTVMAESFIPYVSPNGNEAIRADRLSLLKQASEIIEDKTPPRKFLFFHFTGPHEPFVFNETGGLVAYENMHNWADTKHYVGQLRYITKRIEELVDRIIEQDPHAVVLIQSDHGARYFRDIKTGEMNACLNNLYLGGDPVEVEGMSPINTLRLALNRALGLDLEFLEDVP